MERILVVFEGGLIQSVLNVPRGVVVEVRDYDTGQREVSAEDRIYQDENGDFYHKSEWGPE